MKKNFCFILALVLCFMLSACGKYKKYNTLIDYLEAGDYEQAIQEVEQLRQNTLESKKTINIEITLDNWQDYYEIVLVADAIGNAFGEIERANARHMIRLKEPWKYRFVESSIAMAWTVSEYAQCDFQTKFIVQETGNYSGYFDCSYRNARPAEPDPYAKHEGTMALIRICENIPYEEADRYYDENIKFDGDTLTWTGFTFQKIDFTRIEGTLTLTEE